jgi:hypothetical protein
MVTTTRQIKNRKLGSSQSLFLPSYDVMQFLRCTVRLCRRALAPVWLAQTGDATC